MAKKKAAKSAAVTKKSPAKKDPAVKASAVKAEQIEKRPIDSYTHGDKRRSNNPPVGLVTPQNDSTDPPKKTYAFDPHLDPQLVWAGKAERTSFEVPSISLHVHERIDPKSIIAAAVWSHGHGASVHGREGEARGSRRAVARGQETRLGSRQLSLFEQPEQNPPLRDALDFYTHPHGKTRKKPKSNAGSWTNGSEP